MIKKYVITSYIPNTEVNASFVRALNKFTEHKNATLQILQCKENYRLDNEQPLELAIREEFGNTIITKPYNLSKHLHVSDFRISINTIDPLSGMESFAAKHGCMILPFPRHRFKVVPRMLKESKTPRAIWCSGTISEPTTYKNNKSGTRMKDYHEIGALYVEVDDKTGKFNIRQLQFDGIGFYDLDLYFTESKITTVRPEFLSMGDDHAVFQDPEIMNMTEEFILQYRPKALFRHDTLDSASISHHLEGKHLTKATVPWTLEEELKITSDSIARFDKLKFLKQYMVPSNHPDHLDRYIDEARYKEDYPNHILGLELAWAKAKGEELYEYSMRKFNDLKNTVFPKRKESIKISGIELNDHGDQGASGSKGNPREKGITYAGNVITGHTHSPEIGVFNNFVNGTSTFLSLHYTKDSGSSNWLNTHTLGYKNGKRTHIHFIKE